MRFKITGQRSGAVPQVYETDDYCTAMTVARDYMAQGYSVHGTDIEGRLLPAPAPVGWVEVTAWSGTL